MSEDLTERFRNEVCTFMGTTAEALKHTSTRLDKLSDSVQALKHTSGDTSIAANIAEILAKLNATTGEPKRKKWYEYLPIVLQVVALLAILWGLVTFVGRVSPLFDPAFMDRLQKIEKKLK